MAPIEKAVILALRTDSRFSYAGLSRETGFAQSSLFEKHRSVRNRVVRRHHAILDYHKAGFPIRVLVAMKAARKAQVRGFLDRSSSVNNLYRINNGFDFLADALFATLADADRFLEELAQQGATKIKSHLIAEPVREEFLFSRPEHFG